MAVGRRINKNCLAVSNKHYRYYTFERFLKTQRDLGIKKIELWGGTPHVWIDAYRADNGEEMKKRVLEYELEIAVFVPEFSSYRYSLGILNPSVHSKSMEYLKRCMHYTAQLKAEYILIELNGYSLDGDFARQWESLLKTVDSLGTIAAQEGIKSAILPSTADRTNLINSIGRLRSCLNTVNNPNILPALDLTSMYMAAETVDDWMKEWRKEIAYVHISDYEGKVFWGDGQIDAQSLLETLRRLEQCGYYGTIGAAAEKRGFFVNPEQWSEKAAEYFDIFFGDGGRM